MFKIRVGFLVFFMMHGFSMAQDSSNSSSTSDDNWYKPPDCSLAPYSPFGLQEKFSRLYIVDLISKRYSNGQSIETDVVVHGLGTQTLFRGKQNCLKSLASKKKYKNSDLNN